MKKIIFICIIACLLIACTPQGQSPKDNGSTPEESSQYKNDTISQQSSDMVLSENAKDDFVEKFERAILEQSIIFQNEYGYYFKDEAYFEYIDINNDNLPELILSISIHKTNSFFIFALKEDTAEMYDGIILNSDNCLDIYRSIDKVILRTVYKYFSGTKVADVNTQFSTIDNAKIKEIVLLNFVENIETGEIQYYNSSENHNKISKKQYDELEQSIIGEDFTKETVYLDNYVVDYMQGDNLYNALYESYQEYQERTK